MARTISKQRIKRMVEVAIASRIKADDSGERDDVCEAAMKEWDTVVEAAREFIDVYEKAIKNEDIKKVSKYDSDFTGLLDKSKSLYGDFLNSVWDIETAIRMVYQIGATSLNKPEKTIKADDGSEVGDTCKLSELEGDEYTFVQEDYRVAEVVSNAKLRNFDFTYAITKGEEPYDEVWGGNSANLSSWWERVK